MNNIMMNSNMDSLEKQLKLELMEIIAVLDREELPSEEQKAGAIKLLKCYISEIGRAINYAIKATDVSSKDLSEEDLLSELLEIKDIDVLLTRLSLQKIICDDDMNIETENIAILIEKGFISKIEISNNDFSEIYYGLTSKGKQCLKYKSITERFATQNPRYIGTSYKSLFKDEFKNSLSFLKMRLLNRYFKEEPHYIFAMNNDEKFIYGCRVSNELSITYYLPAVVDKYYSDDDKKKLVEMILDDMIDEIIVVSEDESSKNNFMDWLDIDVQNERINFAFL